MPSYQVIGLSKSFPRYDGGETITALQEIHFTAKPGELLVLLGPTGAGKTTLLRTLAGLEKPNAGQILEDQKDITQYPPHHRDVAMVFQNFSLYPNFTVHENLAFPLRAKWRAIAETQIVTAVQEIATMLGLQDKLQRHPQELSGGEQQRVAIGRALIRKPKLFLLDEPLAHLDAKLREQMISDIHHLQRKLGVTMLYVTHDQIEAMSLADRIVAMDNGKVLQIGTPDEIYQKPRSARVARMLGSPMINLFSRDEATRMGINSQGFAQIGVRPEHVLVKPNLQGQARVKVYENLGAMAILLLEWQGLSIRVLTESYLTLHYGDTVDISVDGDKILYLEV